MLGHRHSFPLTLVASSLRLSGHDEPAAASTTGGEETEERLRPQAPALALDPLVKGQPLCSVCG
jgi:hypothetical protein